MAKIKSLFATFAVLLMLTSCSTTKTLYDWKGYDNAAFAFSKESSEDSLADLLEIYSRLIDKPKGMRKVPAPGICADYGYLLIKNGETERGKELIIKETVLYPESKVFLDRIIKRFEE